MNNFNRERLYAEIEDLKERFAELEQENLKALGWIAKAMMRGLHEINCGDELIKIAEINNLEHQAKGIEEFAVAFLSGHLFSVAINRTNNIRNQAKEGAE